MVPVQSVELSFLDFGNFKFEFIFKLNIKKNPGIRLSHAIFLYIKESVNQTVKSIKVNM